MDARRDYTKTLIEFSEADCQRIIDAITPTADCSCAEYIGDDERCKIHGSMYDKYAERERQARECEADAEWLESDTSVNLPIGDQIALLTGLYDLRDGSDNTLRGSRMDAGYGESGML